MVNGQNDHTSIESQLDVPSGDPEKCERCNYFMICRIRLHEDAEQVAGERKSVRRKRISKGHDLLEAGKPFDGLYVITDGSFKSVVRAPQGKDAVVGFHFPGEYVGLDAYGNGFYSSTVQALENSWYCSLDVSGINRIGAARVDLQSEIIRNLSLDTRHFQWRCQYLLRATVDQRLASTLVDFARRLGDADKPMTRFRLPMSRRDIANYLGMAPETLYRTLRRLTDAKLVEMDGRVIEILSLPGLIAFTGQSGDASPQADDEGSVVRAVIAEGTTAEV